MGRRPKNELADLARTAKAQLKRADMLGKSLDARLKTKVSAAEEFTLTDDDRRDFASITQTIQHAGNSLVRALEGNKKNLGGLTEEQLTAQFNAEIVASAAALTDDQWARMKEARTKAGRPV